MLYQVHKESTIDKIRPLFNDIRFYTGNSILDGFIGNVYVDNEENPKVAFLQARLYCMVSGDISDDDLKEILSTKFYDCNIIPTDKIAKQIEQIYTKSGLMAKSYRYATKKNSKFDIDKLHSLINTPIKYKIEKITKETVDKIKNEKFINITNEDINDIGYCCFNKEELIGVCGVWYNYKDGIEVNIKVKDEYQRQGIAANLAAHVILDCLEKNIKVNWDAANLKSVGLAKKLGFEIDKQYPIYFFI